MKDDNILTLFPDLPAKPAPLACAPSGKAESGSAPPASFIQAILVQPEKFNRAFAEQLADQTRKHLGLDALGFLMRREFEMEDMVQFWPLSAVLRHTREAKGLSVKEVATAFKVRQMDVRAIEQSTPRQSPATFPARYVEFLGLREWYSRWIAANPEMRRFCGPLAERDSSRAGEKAAPLVWQMKATLRGYRPAIWRRFLIRDTASLYDLHRALQVLMDWQDYHLHSFDLPGMDIDWEADENSYTQGRKERVNLREFGLEPKSRFRYCYDFGDNWELELLIEKILPLERGASYPWCVAGERAAPPEDSGGIWGYAEKLQIIRDRKHSDHADIKAWMGADFDPEHFDLAGINATFHPKRKVRMLAKED